MTTLALLRTELTLLRRDTTAWATAIALPFVLGAWWIINEPPFGDGAAAIVTMQVALLLVFTLHTVGTMALASRREQLVLKRWRSSQAGPVSVLVGTIGVPAGLVLLQAGVLVGLTMRSAGQGPANVAMLVVAVVSGIVTVAALTFLAAAFTRSAEHAMITTFPVILLLMGSTVWALLRPFDGDDWALLALPGGAVATLTQLAWDGPAGGSGVLDWLREAAPSLAATVVITVAATAAAVRWFRWEPRR